MSHSALSLDERSSECSGTSRLHRVVNLIASTGRGRPAFGHSAEFHANAVIVSAAVRARDSRAHGDHA
jgi:hypothetical protein